MLFNTTFANILNIKGNGHILISDSMLIKQSTEKDIPKVQYVKDNSETIMLKIIITG